MSSAHKVVIAAGGTGGHLYPAVALAKELTRRGCDVLFIVKDNELTRTSLQKESLRFESVTAAPWVGQSPLRVLIGIPAMIGSVRDSMELLQRFGAERVVGFGAYVSVPVVLAARMLRIPIDVHEQNPSPGWANRLAALFARRVAVSFPQTLERFGTKAVLTGNLVRQDLLGGDRAEALNRLGLQKHLKTILVFGGSGGAKSINRAVADGLQKFIPLRDQVQFFHVSGSPDETSALAKRYHALDLIAAVRDYCHEMRLAYAAADLVVCRAGATTISELLALGLPSILVPYPYAGAHQDSNARVAESLGAARIVRESSSLSGDLTDAILTLARSPQDLVSMRTACGRFPVDLRAAASKMADIVLL